MSIFIITFIVLLMVVFAMSLGVLLNDKTIKGSCGGIASVPGMEDYKSGCSCDNPCEKKKARLQQQAQSQAQPEEQIISFKRD